MSEEWERGLAEALVAEAAAERRRARRERELLSAEAGFDALLVALTTRGEVRLTTDDGAVHHGTVVAVGPDALVLRGRESTTILRVAGVVALEADTPVVADAAPGAAEGPLLVELLAELADRGEPVRLRAGPATWTGVVGSVGDDVVSLELADGSVRYVRLASVNELSC